MDPAKRRGERLDGQARVSQFPLYAPLGLRSVSRIRVPPHTTRTGLEAVIPYIRLYWIVDGTGWISLDGEVQPLRQGDVLLYGPGPRSVLWTEAETLTYRVLAFDGTAMTSIADGLRLPRRPVRIHTDLAAEFDGLGGLLVGFDRSAELAASTRLYAFLSALSLQLDDAMAPPAGGARWGAQATQAMERDFRDSSVGVSQFADRFGMHRSAFTRRFTETIGQSPKAYLDRLRLQRSITLLSDTTLPMDEVARRSGFASSHGMARVFRRLMARSPSSFRNGQTE